MVSSCVISNKMNPICFANEHYAEKYKALELLLIQNEQNTQIQETILSVGSMASSWVVSWLLTEMLVSRLSLAYFGEEVVYKQSGRFKLDLPPLLTIGLAILIILVIKIAKNYFPVIDCRNQLNELIEIKNRALAFQEHLKKTDAELRSDLSQFRVELPVDLDDDLRLTCFCLKYNLDKISLFLDEIDEFQSEIQEINRDAARQEKEQWDKWLGQSGIEKNKQAIEEKNGEILQLISDCKKLVQQQKEKFQLGADCQTELAQMPLVKAHISSQITPQFFNNTVSLT